MKALSLWTLLLLWPGWAVAQRQDVFEWDYPRTVKADAFMLTAQGAGGQLTWRTAASPAGSCPDTSSPDIYCTKLPQCPAAGPAQFSVRAITGSVVSGPSDPLPCQILTQTPCQMTCQGAPGSGSPAPPGQTGQTGQTGTTVLIPSTTTPVQSFAAGPNVALVPLPALPTQEPTVLPPVQAAPALPAFQPAPSVAPV
jgi:hypothetical protein